MGEHQTNNSAVFSIQHSSENTALHMAKGTSRAEVTLNSEKIKPNLSKSGIYMRKMMMQVSMYTQANFLVLYFPIQVRSCFYYTNTAK